MMNKLNLTKIEDRINRHFLEDGLIEIILGIWLMFHSTQVYFDFLPNIPYATFMFLFILLAFGPVYKTLRRHFTEPRIGYVKIKPSSSIQNRTMIILFVGMLLILGLGMGAFLLIFLSRPGESLDFVYIKNGGLFLATFIFVAGLLYWAIVHQLQRFYLLSVLLVLNNIALILLNLDGLISFSILFVTNGLLLVLSGLLTLGRFIHQNPIPTEDI